MRWTGLALTFILGATALALLASPGAAATRDRPVFGRPAGWVHPGRRPDIPDASPADAPRVLLYDQQVHFGSDGVSIYTESVARLETAQDVAAAGAVALPWNPALGELRVHRIEIVRGGKTLDALKKQRFTVEPRRPTPDYAVLDPTLVATLQPEDLRVGDVVDMAFTVTRKDPALGETPQAATTIPDLAMDRLTIRADADARHAFRWKAGSDLAPAAETVASPAPTAEPTREVAFELKAVQPLSPPADAPARFRQPRRVEFGGFAAWGEVSTLMAPLFAKAASLEDKSPMRAEVEMIRARYPAPRDQAQAALAVVQDQVRFLPMELGDNGLAPAPADQTWSRRLGDAKGKAALLLALLQGLGLTAQPALVNTAEGDGLPDRLPAPQAFDHVLVRLEIEGRVYWLDPTRTGDRRLDDIPVPPFRWALPVQAGGAELVALTPAPLARPEFEQALVLDASAGLDAPAHAHAEAVLRGDAATALNSQLTGLAPAQLAATLKAYWSKADDFLDVVSATAAFDPDTGEERLSMDGRACMAWTADRSGRARRYLTDGSRLGWRADWRRQPGPYAEAPVAVDFPAFTRTRERIVLPHRGEGFSVDGPDIDVKLAGLELRRTSTIRGGVFGMETSSRSLAWEIPAAEAEPDAQALRKLADSPILIRAPEGYGLTAQEMTQLADAPPTTSAGYLARGRVLLDNDRAKDAAADFRQAWRLDPQSGEALGQLGVAEAEAGDATQARVDLDHAAKLKGGFRWAAQGYGVLALQRHAYGEAVAAFSNALQLAPDDATSLWRRAQAHAALGETDPALTDAASLLRLDPGHAEARLFRIRLMLGRGDKARALAEADAALAQSPNLALFHLARGGALAALGRTGEAQAAFKRALALAPTRETYLAREAWRARNDYAGRLMDIDAALRLAPADLEARRRRAETEAGLGDDAEALAELDRIVADHPDDLPARLLRGRLMARARHAAAATADFDWARSQAPNDPARLEALCRAEAATPTTLKAALADCDAGLKLNAEDPELLDARALVLLRLGRFAEAATAYDAALAPRPAWPLSLYGRGQARLRKGDRAAGEHDLDAARMLAPDIAADFDGR